MCMVSSIGDAFGQRWPDVVPITPAVPHQPTITFIRDAVTREEFEQLKREVEAIGKLLRAAKDFDAETGQADCDDDAKLQILKSVADALGIDLPITEAGEVR